MTRRSLPRICTAIAGAAVMAAIAHPAVRGGTRQAPTGDPGTAARAQAQAALGPFRLGQQVQSSMHLSLRLEFGRGAPQLLDVTGQWTATPVDLHDGMVEVQCTLAPSAVRIDAHTDSTRSAAASELQRVEREMAAALAAPFFISYRADGAIASLWFARNVNPAIANVQMTLAGLQQLLRGPPGQPAWVVRERDVNGPYTTAYRQIAPDRFEKTKARYLAANSLVGSIAAGAASRTDATGRDSIQPAIRIERSSFMLRTDPRGRLLEVRGGEELVFELGSPELSMKVAVALELDDSRTVEAAHEIGGFDRARPALDERPLESFAGDPQAERARQDRAILDRANLGELRVALATLSGAGTASSADSSERERLRRRFEALFRLDMEAAARAPEVVRDEPVASAKIVLGGLALARTAASQAALVAIAHDPRTAKRIRGDAIQYLADQDAPSSEAVTRVAGLLDEHDPDLRQMATLTYGTMAHHLRPSAPERSRRITEDLLDRLQRATLAEVRVELIIALGNAGAPEALPELRRLADAGPLRERARAIEALRFVQHPDVDAFLAEVVSASHELTLRLAAIDAIRFRDVGPYASQLVDLARSDPANAVRRAALTLLGDRLDTLPTLRPVLEEIQRGDAAPEHRALAARYLASSGRSR